MIFLDVRRVGDHARDRHGEAVPGLRGLSCTLDGTNVIMRKKIAADLRAWSDAELDELWDW